MTNSFNVRTNRNRAIAMLLLWVFALISGIVNACLLESPGATLHTAVIGLTSQHDVPHGSLSGHQSFNIHSNSAGDVDRSKQPCLKACDDSLRSLPKTQPVELADPQLPIIVAVLWSLAEPIRLQYKQPIGTQRVASQVPLRHRFSRLAL